MIFLIVKNKIVQRKKEKQIKIINTLKANENFRADFNKYADEKLNKYHWCSCSWCLGLFWRNRKIKQFYDIERHVHFTNDYKAKPMDIVFLSYDEPSAEAYWQVLKEKYPRAKRIRGVKGRTKAYHTAATMSETDYFFAVFPKSELAEEFDFNFQPDRMRNPCHYIFDCYIPSIDLRYGWGGIILYNKELVMKTNKPSLDFTMSQAHCSVPILSAISNCNETPLLAYRSAYREVIKLLQMNLIQNY